MNKGFYTKTNTRTYTAPTSASYAENASLLDGRDGTVFASTGSNTFKGTQTISGSLITTGSVLVRGLTTANQSNVVTIDTATGQLYYTASSAFGGGGGNAFPFTGNAVITGSLTVIGSTQITGSLNAASITGSLLGTASFATSASRATTSSFATSASYASGSTSASYAATSSNVLGGKATHVPFFITDTTLATSSIYQSGSSTVIINQDNATSANPEALYVWQPSQTSFNVISGKGNLNNYLQLNIQNTNQGISASSDVVATANNGNETTNYMIWVSIVKIIPKTLLVLQMMLIYILPEDICI